MLSSNSLWVFLVSLPCFIKSQTSNDIKPEFDFSTVPAGGAIDPNPFGSNSFGDPIRNANALLGIDISQTTDTPTDSNRNNGAIPTDLGNVFQLPPGTNGNNGRQRSIAHPMETFGNANIPLDFPLDPLGRTGMNNLSPGQQNVVNQVLSEARRPGPIRSNSDGMSNFADRRRFPNSQRQQSPEIRNRMNHGFSTRSNFGIDSTNAGEAGQSVIGQLPVVNDALPLDTVSARREAIASNLPSSSIMNPSNGGPLPNFINDRSPSINDINGIRVPNNVRGMLPEPDDARAILLRGNTANIDRGNVMRRRILSDNGIGRQFPADFNHIPAQPANSFPPNSLNNGFIPGNSFNRGNEQLNRVNGGLPEESFLNNGVNSFDGSVPNGNGFNSVIPNINDGTRGRNDFDTNNFDRGIQGDGLVNGNGLNNRAASDNGFLNRNGLNDRGSRLPVRSISNGRIADIGRLNNGLPNRNVMNDRTLRNPGIRGVVFDNMRDFDNQFNDPLIPNQRLRRIPQMIPDDRIRPIPEQDFIQDRLPLRRPFPRLRTSPLRDPNGIPRRRPVVFSPPGRLPPPRADPFGIPETVFPTPPPDPWFNTGNIYDPLLLFGLTDALDLDLMDFSLDGFLPLLLLQGLSAVPMTRNLINPLRDFSDRREPIIAPRPRGLPLRPFSNSVRRVPESPPGVQFMSPFTAPALPDNPFLGPFSGPGLIPPAFMFLADVEIKPASRKKIKPVSKKTATQEIKEKTSASGFSKEYVNVPVLKQWIKPF